MKDVVIKPSDFDFIFYKGSGKGGQKRNKTENCSKCFHKKSNASAYSEKTRSKLGNKKDSFKKIFFTNEMRKWILENVYENNENIEYSIIFEDKVNSLGMVAVIRFIKVKNTKRKEVKRQPSIKDKNKESRKKSKLDLRKYIWKK